MRWQQLGLAALIAWSGIQVGMAAEAQSVETAQTESPLEVVRNTADRVLAEVTANKAKLDADPSGIYQLVEQMVIHHFDFMTMSQTAMGRYWRRTTPEQQQLLTAEFKQLLVRTYAVALLSYSGQQIDYLPSRQDAADKDVMIATRIDPGTGGPPIPINYRMHRPEGSWLVYDVVIDGISLVSNYRSTFANTVRRDGVDGLIRQLAERNAELSKG